MGLFRFLSIRTLIPNRMGVGAVGSIAVGELGAQLWGNEAIQGGQMNDGLGVFFTTGVHLGI